MTIREIAAIAGVSPAAVSLVINNKKGGSAETRRHIQSIMEECGYVPAPVRRKADRFRLMILKFRAHGIALEENQGFTASIIDRIESECRRFAFDLVMCNCEPATAATTIRSLMENPPDGVILIGTELREADYELFKLFTVPFVVLDNNILLENVDSVVMANRELTAQLVRYLYSLGHREIQYYKFTQPVNNCDERYEGYLQELHRLGLEPSEPIMLKPTVDGAFEDMKRLIKSGEYVPHGAAIADNDTVAIGAIIFIIVTLRSPMTKEEARAKAGIVYDSSATEGGWDNLSPEEIEARLNEKVAEGMINISANTAPIFEDGSSEGNLMLVNESINNYPQKVQIVRNDTGEQIYESGAIAVGSKIERAKLDVVLPAGTYECTAYFHNLDPETGDIIGTAGAIITITIQH